MKTTTKLIAAAFTAVALFIGTSNVNAQSTPKSALRFGIGVEGLLPVGDLRDVSKVGIGITPRLQYGVADNLALTLTSGYYNFFGKKINDATDVKYPSFGLVPVKVGIKAFFTQNLYFGAEVGAGFETKDDYRYATGETDHNGKATKLIASPGIGYASQKWDVGVRYENFSGQDNNYGTVGLRIAYGFGL